jgi:hypothetical protein
MENSPKIEMAGFAAGETYALRKVTLIGCSSILCYKIRNHESVP